MEFDVFISYSTKDQNMANAVCAKMEGAGVRCWIAPRDIPAGATWSAEIVKAIEACKVVVLIFSSSANESPQILREVEIAVGRGKPVLPLRIQNIMPSDSMAYFMSSVHWLDAITEPVGAHLDQLVVAVQALLGSGKSQPAPIPVPVPKPFPWKPVAIAGAIFVAFIVLAIVHATWTTPSGGSVVGTWKFNTQLLGYPAEMTETYNADGTYRAETVMTDSGTFQSSNGHWTTTSNGSGTVREGTYSYAGPQAIQATTATGTAVYSPVTSQKDVDPNNPIMLGTWQATVTPPDSPPWVMTLTNNPDGTYNFKIDVVDQGTYTANNGTLMIMSHVLNTTVPCTYQDLGGSQMKFTNPLGSSVWTKS
jgi:hypothetical protein